MKTEFSHRLLQSAPALIWLADTSGMCHWFNDTWLSFTGRSIEQESGNGWAEGVHPEDLPGCMSGFLEAFAARQSFVLEYRLVRHDGVYRWIRDHGLPFNNDADEFAGYIGYCFDISDWKEAEKTLHDQKAALEASNRELQEMREAAEQLALHDELTGLNNRRSILVHFNLQHNRCFREGAPISLLLLDIDRFKTVNDTFGHLAGDGCLRALADVLRASLRPGDIVGRLGGDEFVVLMPKTNMMSAQAVANKLCERVREVAVPIADLPKPLKITISVGGSTIGSNQSEKLDDLIKRADAALYQAKSRGRDLAIVDSLPASDSHDVIR